MQQKGQTNMANSTKLTDKIISVIQTLGGNIESKNPTINVITEVDHLHIITTDGTELKLMDRLYIDENCIVGLKNISEALCTCFTIPLTSVKSIGNQKINSQIEINTLDTDIPADVISMMIEDNTF